MHELNDVKQSLHTRREQGFASRVNSNSNVFSKDASTEGVHLVLKDHQWALMEPHLPGKASDSGVTAKDNRLFVEAVLWMVRTSSPWRNLPANFGPWNSAFRRFSRWSRNRVWQRVFEVMADDPDFDYLIIDSTIVYVHEVVKGNVRGLKIAPLAQPPRVDHQLDVVNEAI